MYCEQIKVIKQKKQKTKKKNFKVGKGGGISSKERVHKGNIAMISCQNMELQCDRWQDPSVFAQTCP